MGRCDVTRGRKNVLRVNGKSGRNGRNRKAKGEKENKMVNESQTGENRFKKVTCLRSKYCYILGRGKYLFFCGGGGMEYNLWTNLRKRLSNTVLMQAEELQPLAR